MTTAMEVEKREGVRHRVERASARRTYTPCVDILENQEELVLVADVPGATAEDISIDFDQGELRVHARVEPRQPEGATPGLLCEYGVGDYERAFRLGEDIDVERIRAEISHGVLRVHLPKHADAKPKRIPVRAE